MVVPAYLADILHLSYLWNGIFYHILSLSLLRVPKQAEATRKMLSYCSKTISIVNTFKNLFALEPAGARKNRMGTGEFNTLYVLYFTLYK
jgi:hypothetical protein